MPEETKWNIKETICFYIYIQSILIMCIFHVYEFVYSVKFICNPMLILMLFSYTFIDILLRAVKNLSHPMNKFPAEVKQDKALFFQLSYETRVFFMIYILTHFLYFCALCWWFCCLKWTPSIVLKCYIVFLVWEDCYVLYEENMCIN